MFEGVSSAFHCWLNGERIGYSQDSCLPAEFNVGRLLRPGKNVLAVQVMQRNARLVAGFGAGGNTSEAGRVAVDRDGGRRRGCAF